MKFNVVGADKETGEDVDCVVVAPSRAAAEADAVKRGILVSAIKAMGEEKKEHDLSAISMDDDDEPVEAGGGDAAAAVVAKKQQAHGVITLGANSPSDSVHVGAAGTHHVERTDAALEYHVVMNQALYLLESAVNKYLADGWEPAGGLTVGISNNAMQYFQAITRKRKPGQGPTQH